MHTKNSLGSCSTWVASLPIGLVGLGKVAVDQHIPALHAHQGFNLVAGCSPLHRPDGVRGYSTLAEMLYAHPEIEALSICTPPQVRYQLAKQAIETGRHVLLEKPPAATLGEAEALLELAAAKGVSILASWHSRYVSTLEPARRWIAERKIRSIQIIWKEDVRQWHPGQEWIFQTGGTGVFDPGINALSILTSILPEKIVVKSANFHIPLNCETPIQVEMEMTTRHGIAMRAEFDFLRTTDQTWSITVESEKGEVLMLSTGAALLHINGEEVMREKNVEYPLIYDHFESLIRSRRSDADLSPLRIVSDAMMIARRLPAPHYHH